MSSLFSKQVQDEIKEANQVVEASRTYADEFASRRSAQVKGAGLKGAPAEDDFRDGFRFRGVMLQSRIETLRQSAADVVTELGDDAAVFRTRDAARDVVYDHLSEFRALGTTNCGPDAMTLAGFAGTTSRDPATLETLGAHVFAAVSKDPPRSTKKGVKFDALAVIEGLDTETAALKKANDAVRQEAKELVLVRARREEALATFQRERKCAAAALDADLRAVGLDDVADRLVPSRSRGAAAVEEPAPEPAPEPTT